MAKKVFGSFLIFLFSVLVILFFRTGAYKSVSVEKVKPPMLQLFFIENIGPYHEIIKKINFVEDEFKKLESPCTKTFGLFLSDPEIIEHDKLISHVGCAFTKEESPQLFTLPEGVNEKFFGADLKEKFCYKGSFEGSPSLSAMKVYPKIREKAQKDRVKLRLEALEVYHANGNSVKTDVFLCEE